MIDFIINLLSQHLEDSSATILGFILLKTRINNLLNSHQPCNKAPEMPNIDNISWKLIADLFGIAWNVPE